MFTPEKIALLGATAAATYFLTRQPDHGDDRSIRQNVLSVGAGLSAAAIKLNSLGALRGPMSVDDAGHAVSAGLRWSHFIGGASQLIQGKSYQHKFEGAAKIGGEFFLPQLAKHIMHLVAPKAEGVAHIAGEIATELALHAGMEHIAGRIGMSLDRGQAKANAYPKIKQEALIQEDDRRDKRGVIKTTVRLTDARISKRQYDQYIGRKKMYGYAY